MTAVSRNWRGVPVISILQRLGLTTNLELCLDAGDGNSYTSGDKWLDVSGNGQDFFRGVTGVDLGDLPSFNGTVNGLSSAEYWSLDGGDFFTYDSVNEAWMNNLHHDNAAFTIIVLAAFGSISSTRGMYGTAGTGATTQQGLLVSMPSSGRMILTASDGASGTALTQQIGAALVATAVAVPYFLAASLDEANNSILWQINGVLDSDPGAYTAPASGDGFYTFQIGARGNSNLPLLSGARIYAFLAWSRALSRVEIVRLHRASRPRFGI